MPEKNWTGTILSNRGTCKNSAKNIPNPVRNIIPGFSETLSFQLLLKKNGFFTSVCFGHVQNAPTMIFCTTAVKCPNNRWIALENRFFESHKHLKDNLGKFFQQKNENWGNGITGTGDTTFMVGRRLDLVYD